MSIDAIGLLLKGNAEDASSEAVDEARRQIEICNACRYCEGFCSVFPAMTLSRSFSDGDITQLANLCHNCRGCYYSCQYTEPHEFALNLPKALAEVRVESWEKFIHPHGVSRLFQTRGVTLAVALILVVAVMMAVALLLRPESGEGFYAHISHSIMIAIFLPASVLPLVTIAWGLRDYWREVGGERVRLSHISSAFLDAGRLKNLSGGAAEGCNYEKEDRYTMARRWAHQAIMWGFLLCFAATNSGTVLHYVFSMEAPYGPFSLPKLFGVPGGILMTLGGLALIPLKLRADRNLGAPHVWGGEMAFILLLTATAATGLALYWATGTVAVRPLLVLHLSAVLVLFLTLPYTKMVHAAFRLAALVRDAQTKAPA
jgi:citrate/tricarballylate utilization protein